MKNKFYTLAFFLIPCFTFAEQPLKEKVQQILNDKTIEDTYERFKTANDTIDQHFSDLSFDEAMLLYNDLLMPFAEKKIKDNHNHNLAKTFVCNQISYVYEILGAPGDAAKNVAILKKAIEFAELSGDEATIAHQYYLYAYFQSTMGNISLAHEAFYKSIALNEPLNNYEKIFNCLYIIAENLLVTRDFVALRKLGEQMQQYIQQPTFDGNPYCLYTFYDVQAAYYSTLSEDNPDIFAYKDSLFMANRNTIHVIESNMETLSKKSIGFSYYNLAHSYRLCYPNQYDSIYYFLNTALEHKTGRKMVDMELEICVYILYAELHFEQKRYEQAEKDMLYVLSLLKQVEDENTTPEYTEAYKFLVMYYETMNRPIEALKYHKLLLENEKKRYDSDKIMAMNDMLVKYETEKKKEQIDRLTEQNKTSRKILILIIILFIALIIGMLFIIRIHRLRKKNLELTIYESALLAELRQNELELSLKEHKQLKQKLEQKLTKTLIDKLTVWIKDTYMEKEKKNTYISQLAELDVDMLEKGYLSSQEKISKTDMKYIICFAIDMDVKDMSLLFNVEPASIRTVRYRIKKKFGGKNTFTFMI